MLIPMLFFSMNFPTVKTQFSIEYFTTIFSKLQVNLMQPLAPPHQAFPLVGTLLEVLLPPSMTKSISYKSKSKKLVML